MSFKILTTSYFNRQLKDLSKKFPKIKEDIKELQKELLKNPKMGTPLPKSCFKIRMQITGKLSGKSGGARVITYVHVLDEEVYLLSIYDKADQANNEALNILLTYI